MAVDTLGHLLALRVTPANEQDRHQVAELAKQVQDVTGDSVELTYMVAFTMLMLSQLMMFIFQSA